MKGHQKGRKSSKRNFASPDIRNYIFLYNHKSDNNKNINESKDQKRGELTFNNTQFEKIESLTQNLGCFDYLEPKKENKKKLGQPKPRKIKDISKINEYHIQTRSRDRKRKNLEDIKIIEYIDLSDTSIPSTKKISKKNKKSHNVFPQNKNRNECKNIKNEFINNEEIIDEFEKKSKKCSYSIKQEKKIEEENNIQIFRMKKEDTNDGYNIRKKSGEKIKSKRKSNVRFKSENRGIPKIFKNKEIIDNDEKGKKEEENKIKKSYNKKDNSREGKNKDWIKNDRTETVHEYQEKVNPPIKKGKPVKCQKNKIKIDNKRKIFKEITEDDNDGRTYLFKNETQQKTIISKTKRNMKSSSNDSKYNNKFRDLETCSNDFSSTSITYKSTQNTPSFKIKSVNIDSVTSLADNYYYSFLEEKKNPSHSIILKKIPIDEYNDNRMINQNVEIRIKRQRNELDYDNDNDLLGHKRKRYVKKENKTDINKLKKYQSPRKKDHSPEYDINIKESKKSKNSGKKSISLNPKRRKNNKKENTRKDKENPKQTNYRKTEKPANKRNKRGPRKNEKSVKGKRGRKKKLNNMEFEYNDGIKSIRSKSADEKEDKSIIYEDSDDLFGLWSNANNKKFFDDRFDNNNIQSSLKEYKEDVLFPMKNQYDKYKTEKNNNKNENKNNVINDFNKRKKSISKSNESYKGYISDTLPDFESPFKRLNFHSSDPLENINFNLSFSVENESTIQLKEDPTFFLKNSGYIKYCPLDKFTPQIPEEERLPITARITKNTKLNSFDFENIEFEDVEINSDTDLISLATYDGSNTLYSPDDLLPILTIPRIKPFNEEHARLIKEKLKKDGIEIVQTETEEQRKEEKKIYAGSFVLHDKKNDIKVNVPVFRDSDYVKKWLEKKNLKIIDFEEDNDVETDEEQLKLEIQRNNEALMDFCRKVNEDPNYIDEHLKRKRL